MSLMLLEVAVLGVLGNVALAANILRQTERLEGAVARTEAVVDSLRGDVVGAQDSAQFEGGWVRWEIASGGTLAVRAVSDTGDTLLMASVWQPDS